MGIDESGIFRETQTLLDQFLRSLLAIRETQEFVAASHGVASGIEDRFVWVAKREFPEVPEPTLQKIAGLVHPKVHERMDLLAQLEKDGATVGERRSAIEQWSNSLREGFIEITGDVEDYHRYDKIWIQTTQGSSRERVLLNSLLITAVSEFETLVAGLIRLFLSARPEILRSSEKKFSFKEIDGYSSIEEFREVTREAVADEVLRGGFDKWMSWLDGERKLGVPEVTTRNSALSEVFQRRHLLVHNSGVVNDYYLERVSGDSPPPVGSRLRVGAKYLSKSLDVMTIAGIQIGVAVARKILKEQEPLDDIDGYLSHVTYDQMVGGRYKVAHEIGIFQSLSARASEVKLIGQVNAWLSLKNLSGIEKIAPEVESWDVSTLASRFKLAKLALLGRESEAYELVKKLLDREELHTVEWMNWPLLEAVRSFEEEQVPPGDRIWVSTFDSPHLEGLDPN